MDNMNLMNTTGFSAPSMAMSGNAKAAIIISAIVAVTSLVAYGISSGYSMELDGEIGETGMKGNMKFSP